MRLSKLTLSNFRSCIATDVVFDETLTVLVGENGSGKSAIIDALRLGTSPSVDNRTYWFDPSRDTSHTRAGNAVDIAVRFTGLDQQEAAVFLSQVVDVHADLILRTTYTPKPTNPLRAGYVLTVGDEGVADAEPILRERVAHVYLPPLRDAVRELGSGDGARLAEVLQVLSTDRTEDFRKNANELVAKIAELDLPTDVKKAVQKEFKRLTHPSRKHEAHIGGHTHELRRLAGLLRIMLSEEGIDPADIASSGLGYANLLYIAMIIVQLSRARDHDLTILLVEEPEAHLHPQLQAVLLEYLRERAKESQAKKREGLLPIGRIQVVVSTHSPNLASSVSTKSIVAVSRQKDEFKGWTTKARALTDSGLSALNQRKIDRYLNVSRSALVFARQIMLVEGIADAIVIPAIAKHVVLKDEEQKLRQLNSSSIVAIEGVDFEPYLELLLEGKFPLVDKVVVVTDGDKKAEATPGLDRKATYEKRWPELTASGVLNVMVGELTLEADLFHPLTNDPLLKSAYLMAHPRSAAKWDTVSRGDAADRGRRFRRALDEKTLDIAKGDFAQIVAEALETQADKFKIPVYIAEAIKALMLDEPLPEDTILRVAEVSDDTPS